MSDLKLFNQTLRGEATQKYLQDVLGEKKGSFMNNITALVANDSKLQACEPLTLMYAAMKATALDLPLDNNLGFAYVIPYKNEAQKITEGQFQIGYKGIVQLAIRSNQFRTINVTDVREGEFKSRDRRTGYVTIAWEEDEAKRSSQPIVGYLGYFELLSGYKKESYWSVEELKQHGLRYSKTFSNKKEYVRDSSVWTTNFEAMAKKTVLKLMLNKGDAPMSVEMAQAVKFDQAVITGENEFHYVDNNDKTNRAEQEAADFIARQNAQKQGVEDAEYTEVDNSTTEDQNAADEPENEQQPLFN